MGDIRAAPLPMASLSLLLVVVNPSAADPAIYKICALSLSAHDDLADDHAFRAFGLCGAVGSKRFRDQEAST